MRVVLPAPLGPNTPKMAPGAHHQVHLPEHFLDRAPQPGAEALADSLC